METQAAETQGRCGWRVETGLEPAAGEGGVCAAKPGRGTDGKERAVQSWRGQMTCPGKAPFVRVLAEFENGLRGQG